MADLPTQRQVILNDLLGVLEPHVGEGLQDSHYGADVIDALLVCLATALGTITRDHGIAHSFVLRDAMPTLLELTCLAVDSAHLEDAGGADEMIQ